MSVTADERRELTVAGFRRVGGSWVEKGDPGSRRLSGVEALAIVRRRNPDPFANATPADELGALPGEPLPGEPVERARGNGKSPERTSASAEELDESREETGETAAEFVALREFLNVDYPSTESLAGHTRRGTNLVPRYGWVMPWGSYGCSKTTLVVDLVFHLASGLPWIDYPTARPIRFVLIVNEGIPGALQDKLAEKLEAWEDPSAAERIAVYKCPWGEFSFRDDRARGYLRDFARDFEADYVIGDPLHSLGTAGTGTPEETEDFKHLLREFGVWEWIGILTPHHTNKAGTLSGDWGRHPDTVIRVEKDGRQPRTKLTLEKARPASPAELGVPVFLEWVTESLGFRRVEIEAAGKVGDDEMLTRIREAVEEAPGLSMSDLRGAVKGDDARIARLAKAEVEAGRIANRATRKGAYSLHVVSGLPGEPLTDVTDSGGLW